MTTQTDRRCEPLTSNCTWKKVLLFFLVVFWTASIELRRAVWKLDICCLTGQESVIYSVLIHPAGTKHLCSSVLFPAIFFGAHCRCWNPRDDGCVVVKIQRQFVIQPHWPPSKWLTSALLTMSSWGSAKWLADELDSQSTIEPNIKCGVSWKFQGAGCRPMMTTFCHAHSLGCVVFMLAMHKTNMTYQSSG